MFCDANKFATAFEIFSRSHQESTRIKRRFRCGPISWVERSKKWKSYQLLEQIMEMYDAKRSEHDARGNIILKANNNTAHNLVISPTEWWQFSQILEGKIQGFFSIVTSMFTKEYDIYAQWYEWDKDVFGDKNHDTRRLL